MPYQLIVDQGTNYPLKWREITATVNAGAWAAAMAMIEKNRHCLPDRLWIIEDDVQIHEAELIDLINWHSSRNAYGVPKMFIRGRDRWWWFQNSTASIGAYNQLCCLPRVMLEAIAKSPVCLFHELWFPKIAAETQTEIICWTEQSELQNLFGPWQWRPTIAAGFGLRHPVKV